MCRYRKQLLQVQVRKVESLPEILLKEGKLMIVRLPVEGVFAVLYKTHCWGEKYAS